MIFYNNVLFSPQNVVIPIDYPTTNCNILLQNIVVYHEKMLFYYKMWYFTTKCGNYIGYTITKVVFYYKVITKYNILLQNVILYHKVFTTGCGISHELSQKEL